MREIKFRGKVINSENNILPIVSNGAWIYGSFAFSAKTGKVYILIDNFIGAEIFDMYEVDPKTVGQYTNLPDKNGKEIYEGDKLAFSCFSYEDHDTQYEGYVVYSGSRFEIWNKPNDEYYGSDGGFDLDWVLYQDSETEIIGNIYDNPELLEAPNA